MGAGPFIGALCAVPFHLFFNSDFGENVKKTRDPVSLETYASGPVSEVGANAHMVPWPCWLQGVLDACTGTWSNEIDASPQPAGAML